MRYPLTRRQTVLAIGLIAALLSFSAYRLALPLVEQLDLRLKDTRFWLRGVEQPDPRVAILAIDNRSIKELGRWPWSREQTGRLLLALKEQGARVIALDLVFSEPQTAAADAVLADAVAGAGNVVLGYFFRHDPQPIDAESAAQVEAARIRAVRIAPQTEEVPLTEYAAVDANVPLVGQAGLDMGFFNQSADSDGLFRRALLLLLYQGDIYPSLGMVGIKHDLGEPIAVDVATGGIAALRVGERSIPVKQDGSLPVAWYGPGGTIATWSAADLLAGRLPDGELQDKLVFVGITETGIADVRATPFDPALPGVEIHATVASNILQGRFLHHESRVAALELALILALPLLLAAILSATPGTWAGLAVFTLVASSYLAGNFLLFSRQLVDLSIAYPLFGLLGCYLGCEAYRNLVVERKGRYLHKAFSSYVSPELVAELIKNPDKLALGGERRDLTVLFSDIRGFTTLSEELDPEALVQLLNRYLTPMTQIVMEERGTLDKFIGDAVMAFFNAPLDVVDHPDRACRTALRMLEALKKLNEEFVRQGLPAIAIGIGMHSGPAVVGNMGAANRFDYTAIGDTVNLASRLEGLTKLYGVSAIISEATCRLTQNGWPVRELDLVRVKGRGEPLAIYELLPAPHPHAPRFAEALALYRGGRFAEAGALFAALAEHAGDPVSRLFAGRCRHFAQHPPDAWDGIFTATEK